jgi:hypothetical protein
MTRILKEIQTLDPERDHLRIAQLSGYYEFPWDTTRALEFALFRTFAVGSIGDLLDKSGEFGNRPQKRYDDTDLLLSEILEHGYDSQNGREAIRRMNRIHKRFSITNEDFVYVLSTFILEPYRWINRFGKRRVSETERKAGYFLWYEIGKRMGIKDIPESFEAIEAFNIEYEKNNFRFTEGGSRVALATENLMLGWFLPRFLWKVGRPFLHAIMDDPLLEAFGFSKPPAIIRMLVNGTMRARASFISLLPSRRKPKYRTSRKVKSYPGGYTIPTLGPPPSG